MALLKLLQSYYVKLDLVEGLLLVTINHSLFNFLSNKHSAWRGEGILLKLNPLVLAITSYN